MGSEEGEGQGGYGMDGVCLIWDDGMGIWWILPVDIGIVLERRNEWKAIYLRGDFGLKSWGFHFN